MRIGQFNSQNHQTPHFQTLSNRSMKYFPKYDTYLSTLNT